MDAEERLKELLERNQSLRKKVRDNVDAISTLRSIVESEFESTKQWSPPPPSSVGMGWRNRSDRDPSLSRYSRYTPTNDNSSVNSSYQRTPPSREFTGYGSLSGIHRTNDTTGKHSPSRQNSPYSNHHHFMVKLESGNGPSAIKEDEQIPRHLGASSVSPVSWNSFTEQVSRSTGISNGHFQAPSNSNTSSNKTLDALRTVRESLKSRSLNPTPHEKRSTFTETADKSYADSLRTQRYPVSGASLVGRAAYKQSVLQRWGGPLQQFDYEESFLDDDDEESEQQNPRMEKGTHGASGSPESTKDEGVVRTSERLNELSKPVPPGEEHTPLVRGWLYKNRLNIGKMHYKLKYCGLFKGSSRGEKGSKNCIACYESKADMEEDIKAFKEKIRFPGRGSKGGFENASTVIDLSKLVITTESAPLVQPPEGVVSLEGTSFELHHVDTETEPWLFVSESTKQQRKWVTFLKDYSANKSLTLRRTVLDDLLNKLRADTNIQTDGDDSDVEQAREFYREGDINNAFRLLLKTRSDPQEHSGRRLLCELYLRGIPGRYERGNPDGLHKAAEIIIEGTIIELKKGSEQQFCSLARHLCERSLELAKQGDEGRAVDIMYTHLLQEVSKK